MKLFLVLFLLKIVESKIVIDIFADITNPSISFSGNGTQNVTPRDMRQLYFIDKDTMIEYVGAYFNGTKPRKVLYSPSAKSNTTEASEVHNRRDLANIFKRNNWDPVVLVTSVKSAEIKNAKEGPSLLFSRNFKNPTNDTKIINAGIEMPVAITLETEWYATPFEDANFKSRHDFVYDIVVNFKEKFGNTGITHTETLGKPSRVHQHINIGLKNLEVELKPNQTMVAKFTAKVCNLSMTAVILTAVKGNLAVNFKDALNGRYWWGPKVGDVLDRANISTVSVIEENLVIKLDYYFDVKVEIFDKKTGLPL